MKQDLLSSSYAALLLGARAASKANFDARGYALSWKANLLEILPMDAIAKDLAAGAGCELDGKLRAAHSSAALAVNTFGPWREEPYAMRIGDADRFATMSFEAVCPTGLRGTAPHLDLLATGPSIVAVESKCTEWMSRKAAQFSPAYDTLEKTHGHSPWFTQIRMSRDKPNRYSFLDSAQLIKHALGLITRYEARPVELFYLYWEPRNADEWSQCAVHRAEAKDLASQVGNASVTLRALSYLELWSEWEVKDAPAHLPYLRTRYDCSV
ncbi:hypothetical protein Terro_3081 [Terriglobus roseus DSM 18391]|uniref:Uncharacterized protein n=1 Tax=Terriglobus roseus (strain DSM 18391 / NRRL B-41598 / KBS 63) TaxID=926566 RepID=I3ZJ95_TERRK|nr:hypothetical protein [Terriglobus roseus]AFL89313.1 hypothetical protein Terro_3081 [Terriglobus roseus DSM 18391]